MNYLRLLYLFYRRYCPFSLVISLLCLLILLTNGANTLTFLFWLKVFTLFVAVYAVETSRNQEFYFYYNLGLAKTALWGWTLFFDVTLFVALLTLGYKLA